RASHRLRTLPGTGTKYGPRGYRVRSRPDAFLSELAMSNTNNVFLAVALRYASLGYRVFPCAACTKEPLTGHGFHDATTSAEQIERWWAQHPTANIGIATEGLLVVDIDGKSNPWLNGNPERLQELTRGPLATTPHGGRHCFFRRPVDKD